jgi:hypothetical protein
MEAIRHGALSCSRNYYLKWWDALKRAGVKLPQPYTGPSVPVFDPELDRQILAQRKAEHEAHLQAEAIAASKASGASSDVSSPNADASST